MTDRVAALVRDLEAIRAELGDTEQTVHSIKDEGCSQYAAHVAILGGEGLPASGRPIALGALSPKQKAVAGVGVLMALMPAIVEIVRGVVFAGQWVLTH